MYSSLRKKKHYLKLFFRTSRRQFCQSCCRNLAKSQKCFAMKPKSLQSMSDHDKVTIKHCSKNRFSSKCANRHDGSNFGKHIERFCQRAKNVRSLSEKGKKKTKNFKNAFFPSKRSNGHLECNCGNHAEKKFAGRPKLLLQSPEVTKKSQHFEK